MTEEVKKISFGFSKSVKKPVLKSTAPQEQKKVDYIECLDEKAIKVIGVEDKKEQGPLIIPLRGSKTWHDRIINKTDADIYDPKEKSVKNGNSIVVEVKKEPLEEPMETDVEIVTVTEKNKVEVEETPKTLEEQAAKEILQDLQSTESTNGDKPNLYTLPIKDSSLAGEKESTLEDYENIPIDAYGMAMLRGMGWKPGKGIGKNEKLVEASIPALRPKGMGLGADKVTMQKQSGKPKTREEVDLKLVKGAYVKMTAGKQKDCYGQIEGLDDDAGRFIVKMALGGNVISLNESVVQAVTKDDYLKNGKVINSAKYEEYKNKDKREADDHSRAVDLSDNSDREERGRKGKEHRERNNGGIKKSKKQRKRSTSDDSSPDLKYRKRKTSESSEAEKKYKKSKKSKKHKSRDSSAERSSKKNRKKDKEREKRRDRRCSESPERKRHKKHKRSRSRSPR